MRRPSEKIRDILSNIFPQADNFEDSVIPINVDYSLPFYNIDKQRIIVYQGRGLKPEFFVGNNEILRHITIDIIVASYDLNQAYSISDTIFNYLSHYKDSEYIRIEPIEDIEPMGKNTKGLTLYGCTYSITINN